MFNRIRSYALAIEARDPACRSVWDVVFSYPGFHAIVFHRIAHPLWNAHWYWLARWISQWGRFFTGIEIHPGAVIGHHVFIDHGMGVVIGETAQVGDGCTIYQGVTLGGTTLERGSKRHPTLGKGVIVGAGSQVLGCFTVGDGAKIGSGAVVTKPVPPHATAVGNPARIIGQDDGEGPPAPSAAESVERDADPSRVLPQDLGGPALVQESNAQNPEAFSAYGVTPEEDPISHTLRHLAEGSARQGDEIAQIWRSIARLEQLTNVDGATPEPKPQTTHGGAQNGAFASHGALDETHPPHG